MLPLVSLVFHEKDLTLVTLKLYQLLRNRNKTLLMLLSSIVTRGLNFENAPLLIKPEAVLFNQIVQTEQITLLFNNCVLGSFKSEYQQ